MSLLKFYGALPILSVTYGLTSFAYQKMKYWILPKQPEWDEKFAWQNFKLISQSKPEEIQYRVCPKNISRLSPYLHQGNLGFDTKAECDAAIDSTMQLVGLALGAGAFLLPVARYFTSCLSQGSLGVCVKSGIEDLFSFSGLRLFVGAYLISIFANFIIFPAVAPLIVDPLPQERLRLLAVEYGKMLKALHEVLDLPANDPKFIETAELAKLFLRLSPHIEQEIHKSAAMDTHEAQSIMLLLKNVCRQILVKQAYP